jgi:poly(3-hydroxyalkanoate) synthetase
MVMSSEASAASTRMPAANHSFYLRHCYLQNDLAEGRLEIGGERLDVSKVDIPVYELAAREDHIAPAKSVFAGVALARKLLIALWRLVTTGEVPAGVVLRAA